MYTDRQSDCLGMLLDLVWYEIHGQRLSFEMEELLDEHLRSCAGCRSKIAGFRQAAFPDEEGPRPN